MSEAKQQSKTQPGALGRTYEGYALRYLCDQGLKPLQQNFRCKAGEIDLIVQDGEWIVFAEVKMRGQTRFASPVEAVTRPKQRRIINSAKIYLQRQGWYEKYPVRFDLLALTRDNHGYSVEWLKNAFY